ncbi:MAG TPA: hypothetical protein VIU11_21055 [Nakamurella sp.]
MGDDGVDGTGDLVARVTFSVCPPVMGDGPIAAKVASTVAAAAAVVVNVLASTPPTTRANATRPAPVRRRVDVPVKTLPPSRMS